MLSWHPRALLFPNFASKEQCETIITLARAQLRPSALALRKGETEESTKDTRTRSEFWCFHLRSFVNFSHLLMKRLVIRGPNFYFLFFQLWYISLCKTRQNRNSSLGRGKDGESYNGARLSWRGIYLSVGLFAYLYSFPQKYLIRFWVHILF